LVSFCDANHSTIIEQIEIGRNMSTLCQRYVMDLELTGNLWGDRNSYADSKQ
jgi:hypothetical protein